MSDCRIGRKYQRLNSYFFISVSEFLSIDVKNVLIVIFKLTDFGHRGDHGEPARWPAAEEFRQKPAPVQIQPHNMAAVTALGFQRQHRPVTHTTVQVRHSTHTNTLLWINVLFMNKRWCANMLSAYDYKKDYIFNLGTDVLEKRMGIVRQ